MKETIKSRCIEFKIILSENEKKNIISSLIKKYNQKIIFDENLIDIAPGNFIKFNHIFIQNKINLDEGLTKIINILINLYKKDKDIIYVDLVLFYTDYFFKSLKSKNKYSIYELIEIRSDVVKNLNDFFQYNLNQNTLLNAINNRLSNE